MKAFSTLLKMQLLTRYGGLRPSRLKTSMQENKGRKLGLMAAWIILGASLLFTIIMVSRMVFSGFLAIGAPEMLLMLAVMLGMLSTLVLGFFFITSILFLSKDSSYLAALPIRSSTLLAARLATVWMGETLIMALFYLPALIIYGTGMGMGVGYYLIGLVVLLLSPIMPMTIAALLSALLIRISALWKNRERMTTIFSILFLILILFMQLSMTQILPENADTEYVTGLINSNSGLFDGLTRYFPPAQWAAEALTGDMLKLALFVLTCAAAVALMFLLIGKRYQALSLLQSEATVTGKKVKLERGTFSGGSPIKAFIKSEWRDIVRSPTYVLNCLSTVLMPVIVLVMIAFGTIGSLGVTFDSLEKMDGGIIALVLAGLYSFCVSINPAASTAITRDAKRHGLLRALPVTPYTRVKAKLIFSYAIGAVSALPISIAALIFKPELTMAVLSATVFTFAINLPMCGLSIWLDMLRPKLGWSTETEAVKQNTNVIFAMLMGLLLMGLSALGCYLMMNNGISAYVSLLILTAVMLALGVGSVCILRNNSERLLGNLEV